MAEKHVLKVDQDTGDVRTVEFQNPGKVVIGVEADVTEQIEDNKAQVSDGYRDIPGLGRKVASIPPSVGLFWLYNYGIDVWSSDPEQRRAVYGLLNSSEWKFLRTAEWDLGVQKKTLFDRKPRS